MTCTNDLTSTEINLGAALKMLFGIWMRRWLTGPSKSFFKKRKSVNPGEWIDAFAFFYCPEAVLAKTVLASRRSRAAVGGICFSADQLVPRNSRPLPFGNEHSAMKYDQRHQGGQQRHRKHVQARIFAASPIAKAPSERPPRMVDSATFVSNLRSRGALRSRSSFYAAARSYAVSKTGPVRKLFARGDSCCHKRAAEAGARGTPALVDNHLSTGDSQ
jgi:hypothetical protein